MQWSQSKRSTKSILYFFPVGETLIDNLAERRRRPVKEYRKLIPEVCKAVGINHEEGNLKFSWSQKAGCSCGCSPGFIIKNLYCKEIFVDVEALLSPILDR